MLESQRGGGATFSPVATRGNAEKNKYLCVFKWLTGRLLPEIRYIANIFVAYFSLAWFQSFKNKNNI